MAWPPHLPEDCPPDDAVPPSGVVYRLAETPVSAADFVSNFELYPERTWDDDCVACGVSVFRESADADDIRKRYKPLRDKTITVANIDGQPGVMKKTFQRSHHTWWLPDDGEPWLVFEETQ